MSKHKHKKANNVSGFVVVDGGHKCEESHFHPIVFDDCSGRLYGFPGRLHNHYLKDLNLWLIDTYLTSVPFFRGIPQNENIKHKEILYHFEDRGTPEDDENLSLVLNFCMAYLKQGKDVAISCYGGHGRTGTMLAIITGLMNPKIEDPIAHIRSVGCKEWVESAAQAAFIFKKIGKIMPKKYLDLGIIRCVGGAGYSYYGESGLPFHYNYPPDNFVPFTDNSKVDKKGEVTFGSAKADPITDSASHS